MNIFQGHGYLFSWYLCNLVLLWGYVFCIFILLMISIPSHSRVCTFSIRDACSCVDCSWLSVLASLHRLRGRNLLYPRRPNISRFCKIWTRNQVGNPSLDLFFTHFMSRGSLIEKYYGYSWCCWCDVLHRVEGNLDCRLKYL